jgi:hypothetical protein
MDPDGLGHHRHTPIMLMALPREAMMGLMMNRMTGYSLVILLALCVLGAATAQVDERARELLEGAHLATEMPEFQTLQHTTIMTTYAPDGTSDAEMRTHSALDRENRRVAIRMFEAQELSMAMVFADGRGSMLMPGSGVMPVPPELAAFLNDLLDQPPTGSWQGYEDARFDGLRSYAGIVAGEQVTVWGFGATIPGLVMDAETRLLFDEAGRMIAVISETPDLGTVLAVIDAPTEAASLAMTSFTTYVLDDDGAVLLSRFRFEDVKVDDPLDESLFDLEAGDE